MAKLEAVTHINKEVPDAYHGTKLMDARKIKAEGFEVGRKRDSYLGDGIYFYEGSIELARYHVANRRGLKRYGILQATVQLGKCLDLNTPEHRDILKTAREVLIENTEEDPDDLTDAFIINWYACNYDTEIDTIRWTLFKQSWGQIYPRSRVRHSEPMICVRNIANISHVQIVEEKSI